MKRLFERLWYEGRFYRVRHRTASINNVVGYNASFHCFGLLVNWRALWIGTHYSKHDKRLCLNLLPCITLWWARPGGKLP